MSIKTHETKLSLQGKTLCKLFQLVQINRDSATGFQQAADAINDRPLAAEFRVWAVDRTRQAEELHALISMNNAEVSDDTSWSATMHKTWLKLRASLSRGDACTVLKEVERGEEAIKKKYEEILRETAGSAVTDVLQRQYADVKAVHHRVCDLRESRKKRK